MGAYLMDQLRTLPHVKEVRGQGLFVGVEFQDGLNSVDIKHKALERHLLTTAIGTSVIRLVPPLIVEPAHIDEAVRILRVCVEELAG